MNDLISRQAAIDAILAVTGNSSVRELYEHVQEHGLSNMWSGGVNAAIDTIIAVPSAEPERKTGRWEMKPDPYDFFDEIPVCSECGCTTKMREVYKFCPNCGADMRGEQDDR